MSRLFKTTSMEEAALLLANAYDHVIAHVVYSVKNPVRLRSSRWMVDNKPEDDLLRQFHPFILRADKVFDSQLKRWEEDGGILLNYRRGKLPECDAVLLAECPSSLAELKYLARTVRHVVVVYQPPSWEQHEEASYAHAPSVETCQALVKVIQGKVNQITPHEVAVAKVLGIPTDGLAVITDEALAEAMGMHIKTMSRIRDVAVGRRFYRVVHQLIPRIDPEPHELKTMYFHLVEECPMVGNVKIVINPSKVARFWKSNIRALVRCGSVQKKETLGFYFPDDIKPDYRIIGAKHIVAKGQLDKMRELMEKTPELNEENVRKSPAHPSVQQSSQPSSPT